MNNYQAALATFLLASVLTTSLRMFTMERDIEPFQPPKMKRQPLEFSKTCVGCKDQIDKVIQTFFTSWKMSTENRTAIRDQLLRKCHSSEQAIISKAKHPNGSRIGRMTVTGELADILPLNSPFYNKTWDTCSVVGNGGILSDSNCGEKIDSADFVFRCNLPPLDDFKQHVGNKSGLVTANRSILRLSRRTNPRPLLRRINQFGDAMILMSDLSSAILAHTVQPLKQMKSRFRPVFLDRRYLMKVRAFWSSKGVKERFVTSGLITISMALEVCRNVEVFGFWPFALHPFGLYYLSHHYYDNKPPKPGAHNMSVEFGKLLELHRNGIIRLHLEDC